MTEPKVENVIILGGGPAGYTAALYAARANLEPLVIEGFQWGGQLQNTTDVENYPGYPEGIMGPEMMSQFRAQAERFGTRFVTDDATRVELSDGGIQRVFVGDEEYAGRALILAMGAEPRRLGIPGELELGGRGVSTCGVCDGAFFKGEDVIVVGGGDSAMEDSIFISKMNSKNSFKYERLSPDNAALLLIDHQAGLLPLVNDWSQSELKNNVLALAKIAKIFDLPVIITSSYEQGPNGPLAPGIKEIFPDVKVIKRQGEINAWDDPNFVKAVEATGRKKLIMAGIVTDVCIAFPALSAIEAGYDVIVAIDASGTFNQTVQQAAVLRMSQAGAIIMNWFSIVCELQGDWKKSTSPDMVRLFTEHLVTYGMIVSSYVANKPDQTMIPKDFKA